MFRVDPERHNKNKLDKLSRISFNIYTEQPIMVERHVKQVPHSHELHRKVAVWTLEQLRVFLEKFFVYRRDFERIAEFFPYKTPKDMVALYYGIKKHLGLSAKEK